MPTGGNHSLYDTTGSVFTVCTETLDRRRLQLFLQVTLNHYSEVRYPEERYSNNEVTVHVQP